MDNFKTETIINCILPATNNYITNFCIDWKHN